MRLTLVDIAVIVAYFALNLGIGLYYRKRATKSTNFICTAGIEPAAFSLPCRWGCYIKSATLSDWEAA